MLRHFSYLFSLIALVKFTQLLIKALEVRLGMKMIPQVRGRRRETGAGRGRWVLVFPGLYLGWGGERCTERVLDVVRWFRSHLTSTLRFPGALGVSPTGSLQATRALMVVGIVVGILAVGISTVGMKCTKCGGDDKTRKARIAMGGGIAFILAGLCVLIGASWFGNEIVKDFYNPFTPVNTKYEFGSAIFVNWAGAALVLIGGGMLSCSCPGKGGLPASYPKSKARSKPPSNKEFV